MIVADKPYHINLLNKHETRAQTINTDEVYSLDTTAEGGDTQQHINEHVTIALNQNSTSITGLQQDIATLDARVEVVETEINNLTYSSTGTGDLGYIQDFIRDNTTDYTSKTFIIRQAKFQSAPIASSSNTVTIQVARAGSGYTSALYIDIDAGRSFIGYNKNVNNQAFTWKEIGV